MKGAVATFLLAEGPVHGYEMTKLINEVLEPWSERRDFFDPEVHLFDRKDVYPKMRALVRDGLAYVVDEGAGSSRRRLDRAHKLYYPSDSMPGAVMDWMRATSPLTIVRAELRTKLAVALPEHTAALLNTLDVLEQEIRREIKLVPSAVLFTTLPELGLELRRSNRLGYLQAELASIMKTRSALREFL